MLGPAGLNTSLLMQAQMLANNTRVVAGEELPGGYQKTDNPTLAYASQANGLTPTRDRELQGRIAVLQANQELYQNWADFSGHEAQEEAFPIPGFLMPAQVAGDKVQVADLSHPDPKVSLGQDGRLHGEPAILQAFTSAQETHQMFQQGLGRDFSYQGEARGRLTVWINDPMGALEGPHYQNGKGIIATGGAEFASDPDVIAHETGHAILDAHRPQYLGTDSRTRSTAEAFADGAALLGSLRDPDVRADVLARREEGSASNLATNIAESLGPVLQPQGGADARLAARDLAHPPLSGPEGEDEDCHVASARFSHGLYQNVLGVEGLLRQQAPSLTPDQALSRAADRVSSDLARTLDFLPEGNTVTQSDLASAMIQANRVDDAGRLAHLYSQNFEAQGVSVGACGNLTGVLGAEPSAVATPALTGAPDARRQPEGPQPPAIQAADEWLARNASILGTSGQGLMAREVYHNDRQETWARFTDGAGPASLPPTRGMRVGFDASGQVLHADSREYAQVRNPSPLERPGFPTPEGLPGFPGPQEFV